MAVRRVGPGPAEQRTAGSESGRESGPEARGHQRARDGQGQGDSTGTLPTKCPRQDLREDGTCGDQGDAGLDEERAEPRAGQHRSGSDAGVDVVIEHGDTTVVRRQHPPLMTVGRGSSLRFRRPWTESCANLVELRAIRHALFAEPGG